MSEYVGKSVSNLIIACWRVIDRGRYGDRWLAFYCEVCVEFGQREELSYFGYLKFN